MKQITRCDGKIFKIQDNDCFYCKAARGQMLLYPKAIYECEEFLVMQDFYTPIPGYIKIVPKRHITKLVELNESEYSILSSILTATVNSIEKANKVENKKEKFCENVFVFVDENDGHLVISILPKLQWMDKFGKDLNKIEKYALKNLKTDENIKQIRILAKHLHIDLRLKKILNKIN